MEENSGGGTLKHDSFFALPLSFVSRYSYPVPSAKDVVLLIINVA